MFSSCIVSGLDGLKNVTQTLGSWLLAAMENEQAQVENPSHVDVTKGQLVKKGFYVGLWVSASSSTHATAKQAEQTLMFHSR